jgi:hypothetical protein
MIDNIEEKKAQMVFDFCAYDDVKDAIINCIGSYRWDLLKAKKQIKKLEDEMNELAVWLTNNDTRISFEKAGKDKLTITYFKRKHDPRVNTNIGVITETILIEDAFNYLMGLMYDNLNDEG